MKSSAFDSTILDQTAHRPWPLPSSPWVMRQSWHDLLFAHWPVSARRLRELVPPTFILDTWADEAWIGVVPFRMSNVAPRAVPSIPWVSEFPELNVRTYVVVDGKPGVYFFSLDAGSAVAVAAARTLLGLPYFVADMEVGADGDRITYRSVRQEKPPAELDATYAPTGPAFDPKPGTLEHWLTERYCLYNTSGRRAYRLEIHHPPWALQPADATLRKNTMAEAAGLRLPDLPPLVHFAKRQDMVAFAPEYL